MEQITFEQLPQAVSQLFDKLNSIEQILLTHGNNTRPETDQLLTIKQAAGLISLSVPTLYGLVSRKEIPVSKRGKRLYFSKFELTDWIKAGRKLTVSEIEREAGIFMVHQKRK
ncbi:helix-turn-helix domain-containing protein [Mucilaginibacter sp. 10I4]|uniref:helix-turn-helix domain-containing protein n=1 Tax=Mucilaginibacter sp. 10I4 TaxID=3048580 RepID=UPI002B225CF4|nr:helix-turn-helix domain-containing protein [Mucilaginibacter sp. 10I4]MEB0260503.1 helix-turn-helix domain-containing protein [Mucilaginibacter sp. 10I4]